LELCPLTLQPWNPGEQGSCQGSSKGFFKGSSKDASITVSAMDPRL